MWNDVQLHAWDIPGSKHQRTKLTQSVSILMEIHTTSRSRLHLLPPIHVSLYLPQRVHQSFVIPTCSSFSISQHSPNLSLSRQSPWKGGPLLNQLPLWSLAQLLFPCMKSAFPLLHFPVFYPYLVPFLFCPAHTYTLTLFTNQFVVLVFCDLFPFLAFTFSLLSPLSFWSSKFLVFFHWLEGIFFIDMTWPDWSTFQLDNFCALYYAETTFTQQRSSAWSVEETLLSITQQVHYNTVVPICCSWRKYCCSICMCNPHIHI